MTRKTSDDIEQSLQDILFYLRRLSVKLENLSHDIEYLKARVDSPKIETMYSLSQVCILLDVSKRTVQRLRSEKLIKYCIMNGRTYYSKAEIERLLKKRKGAPSR